MLVTIGNTVTLELDIVADVDVDHDRRSDEVLDFNIRTVYIQHGTQIMDITKPLAGQVLKRRIADELVQIDTLPDDLLEKIREAHSETTSAVPNRQHHATKLRMHLTGVATL